MEMIALIISGLALLAAGVCLYLLVREKKSSKEQRAAMCQMVDSALAEAKAFAKKMITEETEHRVQVCDSLVARICKLEQGITPDYEKAKEAVNAVNSFNQGISNILGFDPKEALIAQRQKERMGDTE